MRLLNETEICAVVGGMGVCTPENMTGNDLGGVRNSGGLGNDLINIYEGFVDAASHIMERVANAL